MAQEDAFDNILTDIKQEGQPIENMDEGELDDTLNEKDTEEKEDSSDSSTESNQEEKKPSHQGEEKEKSKEETKEESKEEETKDETKEETKETQNTDDENKVPFHKHPRWIQREERLNSLEEVNETLRKTNEQLLEQSSKGGGEQQEETIPQVFKDYYGDDPATWKEFKKAMGNDEEAIVKRAKDEFRKEMEDVQKTQVAQEKKYDDYVTSQIQDLKDDGKKFDEEALKKVALEYLPTDTAGNIDFSKALKILESTKVTTQETKDEKKEAKKKIASKTSSKGSAESSGEERNTSESLRHKSWSNLADED